MEYSIVQGKKGDGGWSDVSNNFNNDPKFLNTLNPTSKVYYVPDSDSKAINNAKDDSTNSKNEDIAGTTRPQSDGYDIGCYKVK